MQELMPIQIASPLLKQEESATQPVKPRQWPGLIMASTGGALLGLSAPGLEQWYLPWFALTSLLALIASSSGPRQAALRGLAFGLTYNLVYLQWYLSFRPTFCEGNFAFYPPIINLGFWLTISTWQGLYTGIFAFLLRLIPSTAGFLPKRKEGRWQLPSFFLIPLLWVLVDKIGHSKILLGVPWASLEYSQYKQILFLQGASLFGGIGLSICLLLFNAWLLALLGHGKKAFQAFTFISKRELLCQSLIVFAIFCALFTYGQRQLNDAGAPRPKLTVAAIQASLSSKLHKVPFQQVVERYLDLANASPHNSLCVWPEWSLPVNFSLFLNGQNNLAPLPLRKISAG
jgi:apolipoprotein N-acyltransferase